MPPLPLKDLLIEIKTQIGYKRRCGICSGRPAITIDSTLDRQFDVAVPHMPAVRHLSRTCEGFAYLAAAFDIYSRHEHHAQRVAPKNETLLSLALERCNSSPSHALSANMDS